MRTICRAGRYPLSRDTGVGATIRAERVVGVDARRLADRADRAIVVGGARRVDVAGGELVGAGLPDPIHGLTATGTLVVRSFERATVVERVACAGAVDAAFAGRAREGTEGAGSVVAEHLGAAAVRIVRAGRPSARAAAVPGQVLELAALAIAAALLAVFAKGPVIRAANGAAYPLAHIADAIAATVLTG